jgi:ribosomal protein L37AE/L43A
MVKIQVLNTYQATDAEITKDKCVTCSYGGKRRTLDTISQCMKCKKTLDK